MSDVQMCWSLCVECVEFLSQMRSGAVLMESRHGEGQTDKQGLYQRKRSDRVLTVMEWVMSGRLLELKVILKWDSVNTTNILL